jgi:hypothetical protein
MDIGTIGQDISPNQPILPKPPFWRHHWGLMFALLCMAAASIAVGVFATRLFVDKADEAHQQEFEEFAESLDRNRQDNAETSTSNTPAIDTSNWQTYRNEEYGIELLYLSKWSLVEIGGQGGFYIDKGSPSLRIDFNSGDNNTESYNFLELGCMYPSNFLENQEYLGYRGLQVSESNIDSVVNFGGMDVKVMSIPHATGEGAGDNVGYRVYRCGETNDICAIFFRHDNKSITEQDRHIMQSIEFHKDLNKWDNSRCISKEKG